MCLMTNHIHLMVIAKKILLKTTDYPFSSALWYHEKKGAIKIDEILIG